MYSVKRIKFQDEDYWLVVNPLDPDFFLISPLDHFNAEGELLEPAMSAISYAIAYKPTGDIQRFGTVIGNMDDITYVDSPEVEAQNEERAV